MNGLHIRRSLASLLVAGVLIVAMAWALQTPVASATPPTPGSVRGSFSTSTYLATKVFTSGNVGTAYSASTRPTFWYQGDVFVTVAVSGTGGVTTTPQFSADGTNWADAWSVTPLIATSDGTTYTQFSLAGEYLRFKYQTTINTDTDKITVTIKATVKNTQ